MCDIRVVKWQITITDNDQELPDDTTIVLLDKDGDEAHVLRYSDIKDDLVEYTYPNLPVGIMLRTGELNTGPVAKLVDAAENNP